METRIENMSTTTCGDTRYLIVDQNCRAHEIGIWGARLIRWLCLERWFGDVFSMDKEGLFLLIEKIETTYKASLVKSTYQQKCLYDNFVNLSKKLHKLRQNRPDSSFPVVLSMVNLLALTLLLRHLSSDETGYSGYGTIRADQLSDECLTSSLTIQKIWEVSYELREAFPQQERIVLEAFFARLKANLRKNAHGPENAFIESVETDYHSMWNQAALMKQVDASFRAFRCRNANAMPADIAEWAKQQLEIISKQCPRDTTTLARCLIRDMSNALSLWKMKETFRAYGVFLAQECKEHITESFENAASQLLGLFREDEFLLVMEGMICRKGREYYKAIASPIKIETLDSALTRFIYKARRNFAGASNVVIRGVIQEIVMRQGINLTQAFYSQVANIFFKMHQKDKSFSVLEPLLGSCICVQKIGSPQAMATLSSRRLLRKESERILQSQNFDAESPVTQMLLGIEQEIVSKMLGKEPFAAYYGSLLGKRILEAARTSQIGYCSKIKAEDKKTKQFLTETFKTSAEPILNALKGALDKNPLAMLERLVENQQNWKKDSFASDVSALEKGIDFCPALEKIAEKAVDNFIVCCLEDKKISPERPSLLFLYRALPQLKENLRAFKQALGLQSDVHEYFLKLLKENQKAKEFLEWIKAGEWYTKNEYEERFQISTSLPASSHLQEKGATEEDAALISAWRPFFLDSLAVEKSIVRSGFPSVCINNLPMSLINCPSLLVRACVVAQALLETVPVELRNEQHKTAIGKLFTFASIEYAPGAMIPPQLANCFTEMGLMVGLPWYSPTTAPSPNEIVYSFSYSNGKFAVERFFEYLLLPQEENQKAWHVQSLLEIDPCRQEEISVKIHFNLKTAVDQCL